MSSRDADAAHRRLPHQKRYATLLTIMPNETETTKPAALGYRMPAEWEPHAATWLSWPRREGISFPDSYDRVVPTLRAMVAALIESEPVCINVCNGAHEAEAQLGFARPAHGMNHVLSDSDERTVVPRSWPDFSDAGADPKLAVVDWDYNAWGNKYPPFDLDEVVPTRVAKILKLPVFYPTDNPRRRVDRRERHRRIAHTRVVSVKQKSKSESVAG